MSGVVLDEAAIDELLYSPVGPVYRHVVEAAEAIKDVAAALIHSRSGTLAGSGHIVPGGREVTVTFDAPYAMAVERGAQPRIIRARNARTLAFFYGPAGKVIFPTSVQWPGFPGQHFLTRAADAIAAAPLL